MINGNVTATLTKNTDADGVPLLESTLRIVAVQASVVTCDSVTNGSKASIEFDVSGTCTYIIHDFTNVLS